MSLTDDQKQAIREEEIFRDEVRKSLKTAKTRSFLGSVADFFETKAGFWLATTVLAGLVATGWTNLQRYLDRTSIEAQARADRSRRDTDTLLKLGPMLTSANPAEAQIAVVLLDGMAGENAVDVRISGQVKALIQNTLSTGLKTDATPEQRERAEAIIAYADNAQVASLQSAQPPSTAAVPTAVPVSSAINSTALPVRVYVQISDKSDNALGAEVADALRKASLIVPGIEVVGARRSPSRDAVRYCQDKIAPDALERMKTATSALRSGTPEFVVLAPSLCGNVRFNHFELWLAARK